MPHFSIELWQVPILFLVGGVASFLNSLSGGGSVISLPIMIGLGIPPTLANGTNRVAILAGNIGSVATLRRAGFLDQRILLQFALPVLVGASIGASLAVHLTDTLFRILLACALVFVVVASNIKSSTFIKNQGEMPQSTRWVGWLVFFLVGFYGGLVQVGVGFILIFALSRFTGLDLVRVNALKGALATLFILVSALIFIGAGLVSWQAALAQGAGGMLGGWLGGKFQIRKGESIIRRAIQLDAVIMAFRLLWDVFKD